MNNDGLIILNKQKNWTSFDCIAALRKLLNTRQIGHTGTLDLNAKGVLVCLVGTACKLQDFFMNGRKTYIAELILGIATDTEDITGNIVGADNRNIGANNNNVGANNNNVGANACGAHLEDNKLSDICKSFIGKYNQTPPMYSAKKVDGQKLLDLARKGIVKDRKAVELEIYNIELLNENEAREYVEDSLSDENLDINIKNKIKRYFIKVECSKGTYIRTLCKDIGEKLGIASCMGNLTRIDNTGFKIEDSLTIDDIKNKINQNDYSFIKPALYLKNDQVVTFGKFETLHLGHQKIINEVLKTAKSKNLESAALIVRKDDDIYDNRYRNLFLNRSEQKSKLRQYGIDNVLYFPYNEVNKKMFGEEFVREILIKQMKAKTVVVGTDCSFGDGGKCNADDLTRFCNKYGVEVLVIDKMELPTEYNLNDKYISTTVIKKLVDEDKIDLVSKLIGREIRYEKSTYSN